MKDIYEILSLMDRFGGNVSSSGPFDMARRVMPVIIKEGLIMTYPTESVIISIAEHNNLSVNGQYKVFSFNDRKPDGDIRMSRPNGEQEVIVVTLPVDSDKFENINSHMLKYGWFNYRTDDKGDYIEYLFEKKFGDRFTVSQLLNMTNKIYHVTSSVLKKKILSQGLIPKESKTPGFSNEPRIYFRMDIPSKDMARDLMNLKFENEPPVVFEVDLKKLKPNQAFFFDSRWRNSIFTFEPIPITALRVLGEEEIPKFKLNY